MIFSFLNFLQTVTIISLISFPVYARCAVCYTNGLSGASIALIIIVTSFIILFFANKFLKKLLNKF